MDSPNRRDSDVDSAIGVQSANHPGEGEMIECARHCLVATDPMPPGNRHRRVLTRTGAPRPRRRYSPR
jgi:hypothetical protein